jgi:uncharacterized protein (TIGR02594 family)
MDWIAKRLSEGHPRMMAEAYRLLGVHEGNGRISNPVIMSWVDELKILRPSISRFTNDHLQAWCGLFAAHCAHHAGWELPVSPLWALDWGNFGKYSPVASFGDVLVFKRFNDLGKLIGGHVGIYVGESATRFWVLGGNEGDAVRISPEPKSRLDTVRRPPYRTTPLNVTPVVLSDDGSPQLSES